MQPLHLTFVRSGVVFICTNVYFLLVSDHESRKLYCCFSERQLVFLLQLQFSCLTLIHKRFHTSITLNNCLRLLCTVTSNSIMWYKHLNINPIMPASSSYATTLKSREPCMKADIWLCSWMRRCTLVINDMLSFSKCLFFFGMISQRIYGYFHSIQEYMYMYTGTYTWISFSPIHDRKWVVGRQGNQSSFPNSGS